MLCLPSVIIFYVLHGIPQLFCFFSLPSLIEVFGFLFPEAEFGTFRISGQVIHSVVAISKTQLWRCGYVIIIDWLFISGCWCHHRNRVTVIPVGGCTPSIPEVGCQPKGKTEMVAVGGADWQYNFVLWEWPQEYPRPGNWNAQVSELTGSATLAGGYRRLGLGVIYSTLKFIWTLCKILRFGFEVDGIADRYLHWRECVGSFTSPMSWPIQVAWVSQHRQKREKPWCRTLVQDKTLTHQISNPQTKKMNK